MLKYFLKLVVLIVAVGGGRLAYEKAIDLPLFRLEEIRINTNEYWDADSIIALSGLEKGKSIFKQDIKYAADRITSQKAVVACVIDRGLFSDISIDIDFAAPVLLINGDRIFGLSREGIVLPAKDGADDFPLVTGRKFKTAKCYGRLKDPDIAYALDLYNALNGLSASLCNTLSEINFGADDLITVYFSPEGTAAVLDKRFNENDIDRLCALHKSEMLKGSRIFDLRFGTVVVESSIKEGTL